MRRHDRSVTETGLALVQQRSVEGIKGRLSRKQAFTASQRDKCPLSAISGHRRFEPDGLADLIQLYVQAGANDVQLVFDFGAQEYGPEATLVDSSLRQCHAMLTC